MAGAPAAHADRHLVGDERQQQHAPDRDRLPPRLQADEDQAGIEDADGGDADGDAERPACPAGEGDAAEDGGGQHIELEADADGRRDAAETAGDQHRDKADQETVDRVEADDRAADRNAAELRGTRVAADGVDAEADDRPGQDEGADDEDRRPR